VTRYDCPYDKIVKIGEREIWGTKYQYTVNRWESTTPLTASGWNQNPKFPSFSTPAVCLSAKPKHGCQRIALDMVDDPVSPVTVFQIHFVYLLDGQNEIKHDLSREVWSGINVGQEYEAVINGFGNIRAIQGIDAEYEELMSEE